MAMLLVKPGLSLIRILSLSLSYALWYLLGALLALGNTESS